mgnify:FL=1
MQHAPRDFEAETLAADDPRFVAALDLQIAQMRRLLDLMAPASGAGALRAVREAFPEMPLVERARAVAGYRD